MDIKLDPAAIQAAVIEEMAERLISEDRLGDDFHKLLTSRVDKFFAEKAEAKLDAIISAAIDDGFDRTYQPTDAFGRPSGETTSIRSRLEELTANYWGELVDKSGKRTTNKYHATTRAEWVMIQACGKDFAELMKTEAANVTGAIKDSLRAELKCWVDKTLGQLFNVKSLEDQGKSR